MAVMVFLPPKESIHYVIFDPVSGLAAHGGNVSASSGQSTPISAPVFLPSVEPDTDGDGLPDDIESGLLPEVYFAEECACQRQGVAVLAC